MIMVRADASSTIGTGHIMRDLVLAKRYFPKDQVIFATRALEGNINRKILQEGYAVELLRSSDKEEFFGVVERMKPKQVVIDNYGFTLEDEKAFKQRFPHIKLTVFDDDYRDHFCDEIVNHNIGADKSRYSNPGIVTLIPPLIREEFYKEKRCKREKIYDVFIAMGGADTAQLNIPIIEALPKSYKVAVVTTSANAGLQKLKEYAQNRPNVTLHIDSNEIAKIMNQSQVAIVTPSVIVHEVLFMQLPFIAIKTAQNQDDIYRYLKNHLFHVMNRFCKSRLQEILKQNGWI